MCYSVIVEEWENRLPVECARGGVSGRMGKIRDTSIDFLCYSGSVKRGAPGRAMTVRRCFFFRIGLYNGLFQALLLKALNRNWYWKSLESNGGAAKEHKSPWEVWYHYNALLRWNVYKWRTFFYAVKGIKTIFVILSPKHPLKNVYSRGGERGWWAGNG